MVAVTCTTSSPFGFTSFPARSTGATVEKDGDYVVTRHDDGSVTLRSGFVEVVVAINFFEGLGDQCTSRMFHILCLQPSTFVGIGEMSSFSRTYVRKSFGQYLEGLNSIKLSTANSADLRLLQSHLQAIASYGLKVGWLMERARSMEAQIALTHPHRELERVRDAMREMEATLPHLETASRVVFPGCLGYEKVGCALKDWRDAISALEGEEVDLIQQVKEHEAIGVGDFDMSCHAGQGLAVVRRMSVPIFFLYVLQ
ncbi:hypothetical protein RHGRI_014795 [Rhododendron griersonianum]|uniref:Uncharacterized protein n=1 Tax=Rhododendron griersonianum TaxID=479676 RepID=A0AAV6KBB5_9ERIC|nr:hypothetical protein RHGRI_014795 [Rhododendron griersonianum]